MPATKRKVDPSIALGVTTSLYPDEQDLILQRLRRDLRQAAATMGREEARYLIDAYYRSQKNRIQAGNQVWASHDSQEPRLIMHWLNQSNEFIEGQIKGALGVFAASKPTGEWSLSVTGIGPVLAAGLIAYIGVEKDNLKPGCGHIWRFAGLDPTITWQGTAGAKELVKAAFDAEPTEPQAMWFLARALSRRVGDLYAATGAIPATDEEMKQLFTPDIWREARFQRPMELDNALIYACSLSSKPLEDAYDRLYEGVQIDRDALRAFIAKRPWNQRLKTLAWKIGVSFWKQHNRDEDVYGKIMVRRKQYELGQNEAGAYAGEAEEALKKRKVGGKLDPWAAIWYSGRVTMEESRLYRARLENLETLRKVDLELDPDRERKKIEQALMDNLVEPGQGVPMLPPGHIQARITRYGVKLFLSHWHEAAFFSAYGWLPPLPYAISILGHKDYIAPPNMEVIPGWKEANAARGRKLGTDPNSWNGRRGGPEID